MNHTHKLVLGKLSEEANTYAVEHYGLELAKISALPSSIVHQAYEKCLLIAKRYEPDVEESAVKALNFRRLYGKLKEVAMMYREKTSPEDRVKILNYCRTLQESFVDQETTQRSEP